MQLDLESGTICHAPQTAGTYYASILDGHWENVYLGSRSLPLVTALSKSLTHSLTHAFRTVLVVLWSRHHVEFVVVVVSFSLFMC